MRTTSDDREAALARGDALGERRRASPAAHLHYEQYPAMRGEGASA